MSTALSLHEQRPVTNGEAEQALLGAILLNNGAWHRVADFLRPEHFGDELHALLFDMLGTFIREGAKVDGMTLKMAVDADPRFGAVGGSNYVARLARAAATPVAARDYAIVIHDAYLRRVIVDIGAEMKESAATLFYEPDERGGASLPVDAETIASRALTALSGLRGAEAANIPTLGSVIGEIVAEDDEIAKGNLPVVRTGLRALDEIIVGFPRGEITVVAARPGLGKTALAATFALNMLRAGLRPCFWSLEMSRQQLGRRMCSMLSGVPYERQMTGKYELGDHEALNIAREELEALPLIVEDAPATTASRLAIQAQAWHRRDRCDAILIDYLSYIDDEPGTGRMTADERIGIKTRALKALAKQLDVPVILLAQLNRKCEERDPAIPQLSDLRGSGNIEQDAAVVLFIYREEVYVARREPPKEPAGAHADWLDEMKNTRGKARIIAAKNRFGIADRYAGVFYDGPKTLFRDV